MKSKLLKLNVDSLQAQNLKSGSEPFDKRVRSSVKKPGIQSPRIWCIGGGKGGIGKSFISSGMGILLTRKDKRVLLVDADFGAANLHTFIKCGQRRHSFSKFLKREGTDIRDIICKTTEGTLDIISGANDVLDVADIRESAISRLLKELRMLDYDEILIDAGPGTSSKMLDLFLMADRSVLISTPEPTSIENTYRFLKSLCLRRIKTIINKGENRGLTRVLCTALGITGEDKAKTMMEIFERLKSSSNGTHDYVNEVIGKLDFSLIINQSRDNDDESIGLQMKEACRDYFSIDMKYLGHIGFSEKVGESVRKRSSLVTLYEKSEPALHLESCVKKMLNN